MAKIKVAVVGMGIMGKLHSQAYSEYERSELTLVCDLNERRARESGKEFNCGWTTDIKKIANDPEIRAVSITTPDFAHTEIALLMIEAGKDILIEKPLTTSAKEAYEIVERAEKSKAKVMVDFQNRWSPIFLQAKKTMEEGKIGKLVMGYARLSNTLFVPLKMLSWASKSGPEWFLFPHIIDLAQWLTGKEIKEVYATGSKAVLKNKGIDAYDAVQALVKFEEGSFFTFETSWILPEAWPGLIDFKFMLLGSKGRIGIDGDRQGIDITSDKLNWPFVLGSQNSYGKSFGYFREPIIHFVDCVYENKEPVCTAEDGLRVTRAIEAIRKSIEEKKVIELREVI